MLTFLLACSVRSGITEVVDADDTANVNTPTTGCDTPESCNGIDDDCDGRIDEEASDDFPWYADHDGDGHGAGPATRQCDQPTGMVASGDDCDDTDPTIYPGAPLGCDGGDHDCSGAPDEPVAGWAHDPARWEDVGRLGDRTLTETPVSVPINPVTGEAWMVTMRWSAGYGRGQIAIYTLAEGVPVLEATMGESPETSAATWPEALHATFDATGALWIVGATQVPDPYSMRVLVARYDPATGGVTELSPPEKGNLLEWGRAVAVTGDIAWVAGGYSDADRVEYWATWRVEAGAFTLADNFALEASGDTTATAPSILPRSDGTLWVAGRADDIDQVSHALVRRFDGTTFSTLVDHVSSEGVDSSDRFTALAEDRGTGQVYVVGNSLTSSGDPRWAVHRVDPATGALSESDAPAGTNVAEAMVIHPLDASFVAGRTEVDGETFASVRAAEPTWEWSFGEPAPGTVATMASLAVDGRGAVWALSQEEGKEAPYPSFVRVFRLWCQD